MKCEVAKERLIDYLYEEGSAEERQELAAHLKRCETCREELAALERTAGVLRSCPEEEPQRQLTFVPARPQLTLNWFPNLNWRRFGMGLAAGLAVALLVLAALNFEASYSDGDFHVRFSLLPPNTTTKPAATDDPLAAPVTVRDFDTWRQQYQALVEEMIRQSEARLRHENRVLLTEMAEDFDRKRREDLVFLGRGLETFQLANVREFRRTREVLNQLLQVSYSQMQQPRGMQNRLEKK